MSVSIFIQPLPQCLLVSWRIVLNYLQGVEGIYLVDVLTEFAARLYFDLLYLFQAATLDEGFFAWVVDWQGLGKLVKDVFEDVMGTVSNQWL